MSKEGATFQEVLGAVIVLADGSQYALMPGELVADVARNVGISLNGIGGRRREARLRGQVSRALNQLAEAGVLVKRSDGHTAEFLTPAAFQASEERAASRDAEQQAWLERRLSARARMCALAVEGGFTDYGSGRVLVDMSTLEALLTLAERSRQEAR